jgi:hypothetical protein
MTGNIIIANNAPIGQHFVRYRISQIGYPDNYSDSPFYVNIAYANPVVANNNSFTINQGVGGVVGNVLTNDSFGTSQATPSQVVVALVSSSNTGLTLNTATGAVSVTTALASGTYTLVYRISQIGNASNTSTATATVTVAIAVATGVYFSSAYSDSGSPSMNQTYEGTVTVVGASFNFKAIANISVFNDTDVRTYLTINGINRNARASTLGTFKSTAILLGPGTYNYSNNIIISGTGGAGSGSIEATQV